jgi:outer membrane protein assembly factor BamB
MSLRGAAILARLTTWLCAISVSNPILAAENWSQFRGPYGGVAEDAALPVEWSAEKNVLWKVAVPGVGWSQPVAWGDKIFLTTAVSEKQPKPDPKQMGPGVGGFAGFFSSGGGRNFEPPEAQYAWKVLCLDAKTGDHLWVKTPREGQPTIHIHANNTYASETPATDGERVVAYFGMTGVYCYDLAGELLWTKDIDAHPTQFGWGTGSSPLIHEDLVFIQCDNEESSYLLALDKKTGDERWRVPREEQTNWATPYMWRNRVRTELVVAGGGRMRSYEPESGKLLWEMKAVGRTSSTPVGNEEILFVDSYSRLTGSSGACSAIRAGASGDISGGAKETKNEFVAWTKPVGGYRISSPLFYRGCLYFTEQHGGVIRCLDAATGEEHYRKRLPDAAGFSASPIASDGKVYFLDQRGTTHVIEAGPELKVVTSNELNGAMCWASPAVSGNRLLVRTVEHLFCIGE